MRQLFGLYTYFGGKDVNTVNFQVGDSLLDRRSVPDYDYTGLDPDPNESLSNEVTDTLIEQVNNSKNEPPEDLTTVSLPETDFQELDNQPAP